jgi:hypothetical protein
LNATLKKGQDLETLAAFPLRETEGLLPHEIFCLAVIEARRAHQGKPALKYDAVAVLDRVESQDQQDNRVCGTRTAAGTGSETWESAMSNEKHRKSGVGTVDAPEAHETMQATVVAAMKNVAAEAKEVVSEAQARAREATTAVAEKMESAATEVKDAVSEVQASVAKARKTVKAESGAATAKMKGIRRAAVAEAKGVFADAKAKVTKVANAVTDAMQKAGKEAKARWTTPRKAAARVKKTFAAKNAVKRKTVSRKRPVAKAPARKVARKTKR